MREPAKKETIRKVKLSDVELTVSVEEEPENLDNAIKDALPGAVVHDYNVGEVFATQIYGFEKVIGEDE